MKKGCKRAPEINGELSLLYLDLFEILTKQYKLNPQVSRQLTNVLYTQYKANDQLQDSLDNINKERNSQNEHNALDVFSALEGEKLVKYSEVAQLDTLSISEGIKLDAIHSVEFDTWREAYQKAQDINDMHKQLSAYVVQIGEKFIVKVTNITTLNMIDRVNTEIESKQMQLLDSTLSSIGANLDSISFSQGSFFGKKYNNLVEWIKNIPLTNPKHLPKNDLKMLISLFQNEQIVDRLITKFGGIEALADLYYNWYRGNYKATPTTKTQLEAAMDLMKSFKGLDTNQLYKDSKSLTESIKQNNINYKTQKLYDQLNEKFKLGQISIETSKNELTSITKVLAQTIKSLGTQAVSLKAHGDKQASQELYDRIKLLNRDLERKQYASSLADFLSLTTVRLQDLLSNLLTIIPQGADMSFMNERWSVFRKAAQYLEIYQPIVESIANIRNLDRDIDISDQDIQALQEQASKLNGTIIEIKLATSANIDNLARQTLSLMLGEHSEITIDEVMEDMKKDATIFDRLYNATKVSHIPTAVLFNYVQTVRRKRTAKMAEIAQKISAIIHQPDPLTGETKMIDTKFMYEFIESENSSLREPKYEYQIISEYDFDAFNKAKRKQIANLRRKGYTDQSFDAAMEKWMLDNTNEIVVDKTNQRTERVPKLKKAVNPLDNLTPRQRLIYNQFLELKGQLDSMLPEFARNLYFPPQVRMGAIDQLTQHGIASSLREKSEQIFKIREDEIEQRAKDTDTGEIISPYTDITGRDTVIPIHYITKLKNQESLLRNFAESISLYASSAINYSAMNEIVDTVEMLGDYLIDNVSAQKNGADLAQSFTYGTKLFYERIKTGSYSRVAKIIEDQKKKLLYNDFKLSDASDEWSKRNALIRKVTSINALTFNLFGAIHNALEGYRKNLEESLVYGTNTFDLADLEYAHLKILKDHVGKTGSLLIDFFSGQRTCIGALIMDRFDPQKEKFHQIANRKYRTNLFRKGVSKDFTMIGYSIGETLNNMPIVYAMLHHIKVDINGESTHLANAFERVDNGDGTYKLSIKKGTKLKDTGELVTEEYLDEVARKINEVSESNHGGMSEEAMGYITSTVLGAMTMQLRRWMVGVYSNYFRGEYYDASIGKRKEGAWKGIYDVSLAPIITAAWKHLPWSKDFVKDTITFKQELIKNYKSLKPYQKVAAIRWLTATSMMTVLSVLVDALIKSSYKKYKDEEWFKVLFYLLQRQKMDMSTVALDINHIERIGDIGESLIEIMDKPFASYSTIKMVTYPIQGLSEKGETIQSGPHKGEDRYWRNIRRYYWKPGELWDRIKGLEDTDELINSLGGFKKYSAKTEYERLTGEKIKDKKTKKKQTI